LIVLFFLHYNLKLCFKVKHLIQQISNQYLIQFSYIRKNLEWFSTRGFYLVNNCLIQPIRGQPKVAPTDFLYIIVLENKKLRGKRNCIKAIPNSSFLISNSNNGNIRRLKFNYLCYVIKVKFYLIAYLSGTEIYLIIKCCCFIKSSLEKLLHSYR
jgi:hypothetical protein